MSWCLAFLLMGASAFACESAKLGFEGTALPQDALQMEGDKIYFFRGTPHETAVSYYPKKKRWCYFDSQVSTERPREGCLGRKMVEGKKKITINGKIVPAFAIRDLKQRPVATVSVINNLLTLNFLGMDRKPAGKRLVFKSVARDNAEWLEAKGWNCPNPRYLSCVGAELTSVTSLEADASIPKVQVAELSKRLGHYKFSCEGMIEHLAEKERVPSSEPFVKSVDQQ